MPVGRGRTLVAALFDLAGSPDLADRWNIAPSQPVLAVRVADKDREPAPLPRSAPLGQ
jgi:hypothetical protein